MIDVGQFCSPLSILLAVLLLLLIVFAQKYGGAGKRLRPAAISVLVLLAVLMGIDGTFALGIQHHWCFIAVAALLVAVAGVASLEAFRIPCKWSFRLSHLGFFFIVFGAFWSGPDFREYVMSISEDETSYLARDSRGVLHPLPFRVTLREFRTEFYPDGVSPKQYSSRLEIDGETLTPSVNHPSYRKGWLIYQSGFDRERPGTTVLRFIRDPWLPLIFLGMLFMVAGALMNILRSWHSKWALPAMFVLAVGFGAFSLARINFGTLMPALRNILFIPHLVIYMMAYSLLAIDSVASVLSFSRPDKWKDLRDKLLSVSSSMLLVGMICGALWAKMAWGDWWAWDPKENWAAVTWILTLLGTHWPEKYGTKMVSVFIILAFLGMQVTWYGVDFLPSASYSMHAYK